MTASRAELLAMPYYRIRRALAGSRWEKAYFTALPEETLGRLWKKENYPDFVAFMKEDPLGLLKHPWSAKYCYLRYRLFSMLFGINVMEYFGTGYFRKGFGFSARAVTQSKQHCLNRELNRKDTWRYLNDKVLFAETWREFFGRRFMAGSGTAEGFASLFSPGETVVVKDRFGKQGKGIFFVTVGPDPEETFRALAGEYGTDTIIEELLVQRGPLHLLNPDSVNTVRMITIRGRRTGSIDVVNAYVRCGKKGARVDNLHSGGSCCTASLKDGRLILPKGGRHLPDPQCIPSGTGVDRIPFFREACAFVCRAHRAAPEGLDYIGWDIAISDDGGTPVIRLMEGNVFAGFNAGNDGFDTWGLCKRILDANVG